MLPPSSGRLVGSPSSAPSSSVPTATCICSRCWVDWGEGPSAFMMARLRERLGSLAANAPINTSEEGGRG
eukprot:scaffold70387_cov17-Tisochrysis_lutea.AAC.1